MDIIHTIIKRRAEFDCLCIQVCSGPSFVVKDISSWLGAPLRKRNL